LLDKLDNKQKLCYWCNFSFLHRVEWA